MFSRTGSVAVTSSLSVGLILYEVFQYFSFLSASAGVLQISAVLQGCFKVQSFRGAAEELSLGGLLVPE